MGLLAPIWTLRAILTIVYLLAVVTAGLLPLIPVYLILYPLNEGLWLRLACFAQDSFLSTIVWTIHFMARINLRVTGAFPGKEGALVLPNHLTHDWFVMYPLCWQMGTLGYCRTVIKKVAQYIPGFGWGMYVFYWPFVSRSYDADKPVLTRLFKAYGDNKIPVQVWLYPESTRQTKKNLADSQKMQREKGYPIWEHVLQPRWRGFALAVRSMKGAVPVIHDLTIAYDGWKSHTPGFMELLAGGAADRTMHVHIERFSMSGLPESDDDLKQWLNDRWSEKEHRLANFYKSGDKGEGRKFPGPRVNRDFSVVTLLPHLIFWTVFSAYFWAKVLALCGLW